MKDVVEMLQDGCRRERAQTLFYRKLSGLAEEAGDGALAERLNELLADEQHHVSRLTARLLELGATPSREPVDTPHGELETWEGDAKEREHAEVGWYEESLTRVEDAPTQAVLKEILASERNHLRALGGKWMSASSQKPEGSES